MPTASIGRAPDAAAFRYALCAWGSLFAITFTAKVMRTQRTSRFTAVDPCSSACAKVARPIVIVVGRKRRWARRGRLRRFRLLPRLGGIGRLRDIDGRRLAGSLRLQRRVGEHRRRWLGHSDVGIARSTRDETFGATVAASWALGDETEDTEPVPLNAILPQGEEGKRGRQNRLGI